MTDHEKLSLEVLDNETKSRAFALVILKMLKTAGRCSRRLEIQKLAGDLVVFDRFAAFKIGRG